ncbi:MAG: histidine--tRNA ligase [Fibrobacterota bacterium]
MDWHPPKGTRDFYPEDMVLREHIFSSWEKSCRKFGFEKYDAPVFEHIELYTQKSGDEIEQQLYAFEDKGGRRISLRPEMTPSVARMVAARGNSLKKPVKWYSIPKLFRYEKMQKGRLREFFQLNMDILGIADTSADAELIAAAVETMRDLGFTPDDFSIHISSRTLLEDLFLKAGVARQTLPGLYGVLDKMPKMNEADFAVLLKETIPDGNLCDNILEILQSQTLEDIELRGQGSSSLEDLKQLFSYLESMGLSEYICFDISIVRGLAYYTGTVFEVFDKKRSMRAIAGGGRYDKLVELYGGKPTPAVGFAAGDVVLSDLFREKGLQPAPRNRCDAFIVSFDKNMHRAMERAAQLRNAGISAEYPLKFNNIGKQMKKAVAAGASVVVFSGSSEENEGCIKIKNLKTGMERTVVAKELTTEIQKEITQ